MVVVQRNPDPEDPVALEAASIARDLVKTMADGDEAFLSVLATFAVSFLGAMPMGEGLSDAEWRQELGEFMAERGRREARLSACLAMIAALALDSACPSEEPEREEAIGHFFDQLIKGRVTY